MSLKPSDLERLSPAARAEAKRQLGISRALGSQAQPIRNPRFGPLGVEGLAAQERRARPEPPRYHRHRDLVRACLAWLEGHGVLAWQNNTGAARFGKRFVRFGPKGASDIFGILPDGRFLAVECKIGKQKATLEQAAFLGRVHRSGGIALLVHDDLELDGKLIRTELGARYELERPSSVWKEGKETP
jgi:hypothetical protein